MSIIKRLFRAIRANDRGNITIETIYVVPLIMWTTLTFAIAWEYYRAVNIAQRATFAVADIISRERRAINKSVITRKYLRTFAFVNGLPTIDRVMTGDNFPASMRVTSFILSPNTIAGGAPVLEVMWSFSSHTGILSEFPVGAVGGSNLAQIRSILPIMLEGDSVVLVETKLKWAPRLTAQEAASGAIEPSTTWFADQTIETITTVRPRFVPKLCASGLVGTTVIVGTCGL
jgi:hypothetical protein